MSEDKPTPDPAKSDYRRLLIDADHTASQDFDKAVMTLAGGALALSLTFIKDVVKAPVGGSVFWIAASWVLFAASLLSILLSFLTSQRSLREAVRQYDAGELDRGALPGGKWSLATTRLNFGSTIALILGVVCLIVFGVKNYREVPNGPAQECCAPCKPEGPCSRPSEFRKERLDTTGSR